MMHCVESGSRRHPHPESLAAEAVDAIIRGLGIPPGKKILATGRWARCRRMRKAS
jgi:hypothetical protein